MDDNEVLSYDNYAARQRLESWEIKKMAKKDNDMNESARFFEAAFWIVFTSALLLTAAFVLTN